jgi:ParB family chromosome partitioning protein
MTTTIIISSTTTTTQRTATMTATTATSTSSNTSNSNSHNFIPLNRLTAWQGNVRRTNADSGLDELASSIAAHGLLQSLVVRKDKKDRYAVVAGRRRLLALKSLAEAGTIAKDFSVPCHVIGADANATEISLVENAVREQMHPADEFDAFLALIEDGMRPADIAARFGVTETVVQQRLRLARVSPVIIEAYRRGELSLAHVMAFAVSDDHAAQERVREELSDWQQEDPDTIRAALTESEITASDRRVQFVTLKAYEKAGGLLRRDLFAQDESGVFIQDVVLLESLVAKKLEKTAAALRRDGWKWVEVRSVFDYAEWSKCERRFPQPVPLSAEVQAELDALNEEYGRLNQTEWDDESGEDNPRLEEVTARIDEIEDRESVFMPEIMAIAGAIVCIGHGGKPDTHCGYVRPEDRPKKASVAIKDDGTVSEMPVAATDRLPSSLVESLTEHRTAAISAELMERPDIALAALVHSFAGQLFLKSPSRNTCLEVHLSRALGSVEGATASDAVQARFEQWGSRIPGTADDLLAWCLAQDREVLLDLLAFCVACSVDAVRTKSDNPGDNRFAHAGLLAQSLDLDMSKWFTPNAGNYFGKITKDVILAVLAGVKGAVAPAWVKAKKSELAVIAEREVAGTGWLPEVLRGRSVKFGDTNPSACVALPKGL